MHLIIDVMTKNTHDGNNDSFHLTNRSDESLLEEHVSSRTETDQLIDDIYLYIGAVVTFLVIFYVMITMIKQCIKYYKKAEQIEQTTQSNALLTEVSIIRRTSSIRNSLTPNHRSSLDIRFQMESRERRLLQLHLIPLTTGKF